MAIMDSILFLDEYFKDKKIDQALAWRDVRAQILRPSDNRLSISSDNNCLGISCKHFGHLYGICTKCSRSYRDQSIE